MLAGSIVRGEAARLVRAWQRAPDPTEALLLVEELATHVLGVSTFFAWTSARDPL